MPSAAVAEIGALYMNARQLLPIRVMCEELGHTQPATPMQTDNNTASGIINGTFNQVRSKAVDMRYYWLMDREKSRSQAMQKVLVCGKHEFPKLTRRTFEI